MAGDGGSYRFVPFAGYNDKKFSKFRNRYHSGTRQIKSDHQISIFFGLFLDS